MDDPRDVGGSGAAPLPATFGHYTLLSRLAVGGMAEILLAVDHHGPRFVAVKRIRADYTDDPDFESFFLTEGRVASRCQHPNLPQVLELGVADGLHYIAMELVRGHTLLELMRRAALAGRWLSLPLVLSVGLGVAGALEHLHGLRDVDGTPLGVVHRDVTPQNVLISATGTAKLIDLGIARAALQTHETQAGLVKGKYAYMAPEQLDGRGHFDHRSDIFSLGVVLHEMLCGRPLFRGASDLDTVARVREGAIPDPAQARSDVPRELAAVVMAALERDPDRRLATGTELIAGLEDVAERCRILPSMLAVRDELHELCGMPPEPELHAGALHWRRAEGSHDRPVVDDAAIAGLAGDPLLQYFLHEGSPAGQPEDADDTDDADRPPL
jgi:serine/threonine protein kinase